MRTGNLWRRITRKRNSENEKVTRNDAATLCQCSDWLYVAVFQVPLRKLTAKANCPTLTVYRLGSAAQSPSPKGLHAQPQGCGT